jgi:hypothetical protein
MLLTGNASMGDVQAQIDGLDDHFGDAHIAQIANRYFYLFYPEYCLCSVIVTANAHDLGRHFVTPSTKATIPTFWWFGVLTISPD